MRRLDRLLPPALLLISLACHRAPSPSPVPQKELSGNVGVEFLADTDAPMLELGQMEDYVQPRARGPNNLPLYPEHLLSRGLSPQVLTIRLVIDELGSIASVQLDPDTSETSAFRDDFFASVCAAVSEWRFEPARLRRFRIGADLDEDGVPDYQILESEKELAVAQKVRFTFEIVQGVPGVTSSMGP